MSYIWVVSIKLSKIRDFQTIALRVAMILEMADLNFFDLATTFKDGSTRCGSILQQTLVEW